MAAAEEVDVEVGNCFATVLTVVDDDAESVLVHAHLSGNQSDAHHHVAEERFISAFRKGDADDGLLGDEKEVRRRLRTDVAEAEAEIVFVNDVGRDLSVGDLLEEGLL